MYNFSVKDILCRKIEINHEVTVYGWVRTRRNSNSGLSFLNINDGSCLRSLQVVVSDSLENYSQEILRLTTGCSVMIIGKIVNSLGNKQDCEIQAKIVKVLGWIENPESYPISAKKHSLELLRKKSHLRPRTYLIGAISRIRHTVCQAIHKFMHENGFFWITTPIITTSDTEGIGKMFQVITESKKNGSFTKDFFGKEVFLTVSGQLNGESYACALSKIYTFGPTFRAENSNTTRHLSEFWMIEPEIAFCSLMEVIDFSEDLLKYIFKIVLFERREDMEFLSKFNNKIINRLENFINRKLIIIHYYEAINILKKYNKIFKNPISLGEDLSIEHEKFLTEIYFEEPVAIINHPKNIKAFYMRLNHDKRTVASVDILFQEIGEILGGSQREERLDKLDLRIKEAGLKKEKYSWYKDLRKYGTVPHSGFGLGLERLILYITGVENIRDVIPFPRTPKSANF